MLQRAVQLSPTVAAFWCNLGAACQDGGRLDAAIQAHRQAAALEPTRWEVYFNLALTYDTRKEYADAEKAYRLAVKLNPDCEPAWSGLARTCARLGQFDESISSYREALRIDPQPGLYCDLAQSLFVAHRFDGALAAALKAIELAPRLAMAHYRAGQALSKGSFLESKRAFSNALALDPNCTDAMAGIAGVETSMGNPAEAVSWYRRALQIVPGNAAFHSNLLFTLSTSSLTTPDRLLEEHRHWAHTHASQAPRFAHTPKPEDSGRKLRIGFVSADFRDHPVRFFIAPILRCLNRDQFEVVCYSNVGHADSVTAQLRTLADEWHEVYGSSDADVADRIKSDRIDVLVDLSGHTAGNRLLVFARKPAPVQVTYIGALSTTGLASMDYWLTDWALHPEGTRERAAERLWRLPRCWAIYEPPASAAEVAHVDNGGPVTFGSFNSVHKLSFESLRRWARVLEATPESRLLIKTQGVDGSGERVLLLGRLASAGIPPERVTLMGHLPSRSQHLALYGTVDIALDTAPFSGGTTTAEALWMGVPVVTLPGDLALSRMTATMLDAVGLNEFIAKDEDDFVRIATGLAGNVPYRAQLRSELRARVAASPLCDGPDLAAKAGDAFREMWTVWRHRILPEVAA